MSKLSLITFFLFSISIHSFSDSGQLLKELPEITPESRRWNMPADIWLEGIPAYVMKGRLFKIKKVSGESVSIYNNPELNGEYFDVFTHKRFEIKGRDICGNAQNSVKDIKYKPENLFICHASACNSLADVSDPEEANQMRRSVAVSDYFLSDSVIRGQCPNNVEVYLKLIAESDEETIFNAYGASVDSTYLALYFRYESIDKDRNYLVIDMNGKKGYVDIRGCKELPGKCSEVFLDYSEFEIDWINLKRHQRDKDLDGFNLLIKELKPCVEKKDIPCIKKYVANKESDPGMPDGYPGYTYLDINEKNEELLEELSTCLDYKQLLPHLLGAKGINKICIFQSRLTGPSPEKILNEKKYGKAPIKIIGVTYPEAVRIGKNYPIGFLKKDN